MFTWNDQQLVAIKGIVDFIRKPFNHDDPNWAMTLIGFAGTGKTTLVQEAIRESMEINPNLKVAVSAPTNKATQVLMNFGTDAGVFVETRTIYSLLGLILGDEGEIKTVFQGGDGDFGAFDVVVVDEGSMVGMMLKDRMREQAFKFGTKVVFMGDDCQLNPVRETKSQVFCKKEVPVQYSLTKVMRQDEGSPIRKLISSVRELADKGTTPDKFDTEHTSEGDGVHILLAKEFETALVDQFNCDEYKADPTFVRALAWTNREVDRLNKIIRTAIYGEDCQDYVVGETIAVLTPVMGTEGQPVIFTDDECKIISVGVGSVTDHADRETLSEGSPIYKVWVLELQLNTGGTHKVFALHRDSEKAYRRRCQNLANKAKKKKSTWGNYWAFHDKFTRVRPAHAMTVHKSQGQTFETVFVNVRDIGGNPNSKERARLAYVATSRARTNLVLNRARIT